MKQVLNNWAGNIDNFYALFSLSLPRISPIIFPCSRQMDRKLISIGPGPYYAIKLWPCLVNTQGGPRRNGKAQIPYPDGRAIPRLYSAGEMGSLYGLLYQGAGNLGECLAFGRIAAREAAKEGLLE